MDGTSKQRKRDATGRLRSLAEEVGLTPARSKTDLPLAEFMALRDEVSSTACTPEQRECALQAVALYKGEAVTRLPKVPLLPALVGRRQGKLGTKKQRLQKAVVSACINLKAQKYLFV